MRCMDALGVAPGDVVSIIGCGGKTSLLHRLAAENRALPVLLTTTTRMYTPPPDAYDRRWQPGLPSMPGITLAVEDAGDGKVCGIAPGTLADIMPACGMILIEADGSKNRPLKGWAPWEPVILPQTTLTVGVCTLWPVGQPLTDELVHRPALFCRITGAAMGEPCTLAHIAAMLAHLEGMFARARGRRALFISGQGEASDGMAVALLRLLPEAFVAGLSAVARGDARVADDCLQVGRD